MTYSLGEGEVLEVRVGEGDDTVARLQRTGLKAMQTQRALIVVGVAGCEEQQEGQRGYFDMDHK